MTTANQSVIGYETVTANGVQFVPYGATLPTGVGLSAPNPTINALDISTITTSGTPVTAINAGHAVGGGLIQTTNTAGFFVNQIAPATTIAAGANLFIPANTGYMVVPNAGAVSVNATASAVVLQGYGLS